MMVKRRLLLRSVSLAVMVAILAHCARPDASSAMTRSDPTRGDWTTYNRTLAGERYSPLADIDTSNAAALKHVCVYELPEVTSLQTAPIVIDGTMHFTTDTISYAANAGTCAEKWKVVRHSPTPTMHVVASANRDGQLSVRDRSRLMSRGVTTPDSALAAALPLLYQVPTTSRLNTDTTLSRVTKVRYCPACKAGSEWNGAAYHPGLNAIFVSAVDWCATAQLQQANALIPPVGTR